LFKMIDDPSTPNKIDYIVDPNMCNGRPAYNPNNPQPGQCSPTLGIVPKPNPSNIADKFKYNGNGAYSYTNDNSILDSSNTGIIYGAKVWLNGVNKPGGHLIDNGGGTPDSDSFLAFWRVTLK